MNVNRKDIAAGGFFVAVGALYGGMALRSLPMGSPLSMGPGYFPLVLCGLLIVLGSATAIRGLFIGGGTPFGRVPWRAVVMLSLATIFFAAFLRQLGLFPSIFFSTLIAALASSQVKLLTAILTALLVAVFCIVVFSYGIKLPIPIFGSWFVTRAV